MVGKIPFQKSQVSTRYIGINQGKAVDNKDVNMKKMIGIVSKKYFRLINF